MELLLNSTDDKEKYNFNWDISVTDGIADTVPLDSEEDQEAAVITYLETNTIPLLEDKGTDWGGYLLKQHTLAEIDSQVRENLKTYLNNVMYTPVYTAEDGELVVKLAKTIINTGAVS